MATAVAARKPEYSPPPINGTTISSSAVLTRRSVRSPDACAISLRKRSRCRETIGWARELLGGNDILLENQIG